MNQQSMFATQEQIWLNRFRENYRQPDGREIKDLPEGTEVIVERKHWEYKTGAPAPSTFYRSTISGHMTVSGYMRTLHAEPDAYFPELAPWSLGWIYAATDAVTTLWIRKDKRNEETMVDG